MIDEHNSNIVMMLQGKLANASMTFKDVLELRTQVSVPRRRPLRTDIRLEHERVQVPDGTVHVYNPERGYATFFLMYAACLSLLFGLTFA